MLSEKISELISLLPSPIMLEIKNADKSYFDFESRLSEIRLRADRAASLTIDGKNVLLPIRIKGQELTDTMKLLCRGSVYAYSESLREGYITIPGGYRVGVAGRAVMEDGIITGIGDVTSICIRISHNIPGAGDFAVKIWRKTGGKGGMLVYSPPGIGKTTLLRDTAVQLSSGSDAIRIAIVDCRAEIGGDFIPDDCLIDILRGYPKAEGIEIATRTLSPQAIVCDEIGGYDEAESILAVQSCGVPLIASAHGSSLSEVINRPAIKILTSNGVFSSYIGIGRNADGSYAYNADFI
ncbi:MAG: hypothetical protein SOZ62_06505 [Eubacteriales bacterium]|nr:hypothetical protein [Eubacteriales bacterium]